MVSSISNGERQPPRKAMLHCTNCDHSNLINGDWTIHLHAGYTLYECPECGTIIDSRRERAELTAQSGGVLQFDGSF